MDLSELLRVLRVRWKVVAVLVLTCVAAAAGATAALTPTYEARVQLFVAIQSAELNTASQLQGGLFTAERVKSYPDIVRSPRVMDAVIEELDLGGSADALAERVTASVPTDTVLLDIVVSDESAFEAARIANTTAATFVDVVEEIERSESTGESAVQVQVVRDATVPGSPAFPQPALNLALGLMVGLALGISGAIYRESTDVTVKRAEEVEAAVGLNVIGAVGLDPEAARHPLLIESDARSARGEAFRHIRTNLQFLDVDNPPQTLVITSPLPSEGKSFLAANLALSLAQGGSSVVLVDADLRRPTVAKTFNLVADVGLTTAIIGQAKLEDVVQSGLGNVDVITSGPIPPNPAELLRSQQMRTLLTQLSQRYDHVILDTPPVLPVTDASVLAAGADATLLVVRSHKTTRQTLTHAVDNLNAVNARIVGAILSMVPVGEDAYGHGYTYAYTYTYTPVGTDSRRRGLFRRR